MRGVNVKYKNLGIVVYGERDYHAVPFTPIVVPIFVIDVVLMS